MPLSKLDELLVDAGLHAPAPGVAFGVAARDDVLADLGLELRRRLLVEVHDRRDVLVTSATNRSRIFMGWLTDRCGGGSRDRGRVRP